MQRLVGGPGLFGRRGEVLALGDLGIRVGFEHPRRVPSVVQPQIDARVAAQLERAVRALAQVLDSLDRRRRAVVRRRRCRSVFLLVLHAPLHAVGRDPLRLGRHVREEQLPHRQRLQRLVAEDADVELAALDVLLDDRGRADAVVDERDALVQLLVAVDDRRLRDADRRLLRERLHDQRERPAAWAGASGGRCGTPRTRGPECGDRRAASSTATCRARAAGRAGCSRCRAASAARGG